MSGFYIDRLAHQFLVVALERVPALRNPEGWRLRRLLEEEWYPAWCTAREAQRKHDLTHFDLAQLDTSQFWEPRREILQAWGLGATWIENEMDVGFSRGLPFTVRIPHKAERAFGGGLYKEFLPPDLQPAEAQQAVAKARKAIGQDSPERTPPRSHIDRDSVVEERIQDLARYQVERVSLSRLAGLRDVDRSTVSRRLKRMREALSLPPRS